MSQASNDRARWVPCDSRSDMQARTAGLPVIDTLETADANEWGYLQWDDGRCLQVGYADIGLAPQATASNDDIVVGINECLVAYRRADGARHFSYRMPFIFHEFLRTGDPLIARDELGFVGLAPDGAEKWSFFTTGPIARCQLTATHIDGETVEGEAFSFALPAQAS